MRSADCMAIVTFAVLVGVTPGARIQRKLHRLDAFFGMLRMTVQTAYAGSGVRPGDGADKGFGSVTGGAA